MSEKSKKTVKIIVSIVLVCAIAVTSFFVGQNLGKNNAVNNVEELSNEEIGKLNLRENYKLEQMVVLSRHNIRAPLSTSGSKLAKLTTHQWFDWSSEASELSLLGGEREIVFGQFFKKYLAAKNLFSENSQPANGEVRFYANSLQRTITTANCFSRGIFPMANSDIEYHCELGNMDPVFNPQLTFMSEAFKAEALKEIAAMGGDMGLAGIGAKLTKNYELLEKVLDFSNSDYAKENGMTHFSTDDLKIVLEINKEPAMEGSLGLANSAADALKLQYYEETDALKAGFGNKLTFDDWKAIGEITDIYERTIFSAYPVSVNTANPMLKELKNELSAQGRKFSYLCGHDSNIMTVLSALEAEEYELPYSIEQDTPIGCKVVIQKLLGKDGKHYASVELWYMSVNQLRNKAMLDLDKPPVICELSFKGLNKNADGLYLYEDLESRFDKAISAYNNLPRDTAENIAA